MSLSRGICDLSYPLGKASAFVKFWKCLGLRPCHFLGFTKALAFPKGYDRFYISLLIRDISYTWHTNTAGTPLQTIASPAGSRRPAIVICPVLAGQHWVDGASVVYTGVCNTYANTDTNMHATAMIGVSMLLMTICDRVHGILIQLRLIAAWSMDV